MMFTGLVEAIGRVAGLSRAGDAAQLRLDVAPIVEGLGIGDSVAVDGACLTVTRIEGSAAVFDVSTETLQRTTLGSLAPGRRVNLERSLRVGDRLGGHFVLGHVDGVGTLLAKQPAPGQVTLAVGADPDIISQLIPKGSIALDGISLTVAGLESDRFTIAVIPHTLEQTTLKDKSAGDRVNLELDMIGKYVRRLLPRVREAAGGLSEDFLKKHGF